MQKRQIWSIHDVETDKPGRLQYFSEVELDRQARKEAIREWSALGIHALPLFAEKFGYFWLSTDQLLGTGSFTDRQRKLRAAGVLFYWAILASAMLGWFRIRKVVPRVAHLLLVYCLFATSLHLLFTMNTRLRVPLIDPILCVLAGVALAPGSSEERSPSSTSERLPSVA